MTGATVDHLVALTVFLAALLLFIGLFNQTIQVAILYQSHRYIAAKCTDLLDNILLTPGYPTYWGQSNATPTSFGLQDPEFTQYELSPFSLMRLSSLTGQPIFYPKTGLTYSNTTMGFNDFLMMPYTEAINYSTVSTLLGTNGSYGFQLTIAPLVAVAISEFQSSNPLILSVNVTGQGFPLSNAMLSYCFLTVSLSGGGGPYPAYATQYGSAYTDEQGLAFLEFDGVTDDSSPYALIVYAHLGGLTGMGYTQRATSGQEYIIPFIADLNGTVLLAHSYDIHYFGPPNDALFYNATFVILAEDFTLRELPLENSTGRTGKVNYGNGPFPYGVVTIPPTNPGILVVTYSTGNKGGVMLMPWGISSLAFATTFGANMLGKEWVATDIRQVLVDNIAYQAKLALWSLQGYRVTS